ncbi:otogelin-like protein [Ambystoma mexicanum]|uniref:otogelin-like protein n=1 Tax=Ambystoma mexicanum TaxID=8296 RepID=UPI0037E97C4F
MNFLLFPQTPSGTTPHAPTTPDICKTVTCEVPTCRKTGETPEMDGTRDECCEKITCVCASCEPALKCGFGHIAVEVFHPDKECCPKYHCECPSTCPPAEDCEPGYNSVERSDPDNVCCPAFDCVPETTTPTTHITTPVTTTLTPTPDLCLFVTCVPPSGCKKTGETPRQIEDGSGEDPCCPEYICECQPCPTPQICGYGYHTLESFDADKECCPNYRCVPNPETTTPTMPTTRDHCEGLTCSLPPHCSRTGETAVEQEGSGEDDCCPEYSCECGPCSAAADCQQGFRLVKSFDPETECCARYTCGKY